MDILNDISCLMQETVLQFTDLDDYWEELRKNGLDDPKKLQGMFNKAKKIAKQQNKENDKDTVIGIVQSFMEN